MMEVTRKDHRCVKIRFATCVADILIALGDSIHQIEVLELRYCKVEDLNFIDKLDNLIRLIAYECFIFSETVTIPETILSFNFDGTNFKNIETKGPLSILQESIIHSTNIDSLRWLEKSNKIYSLGARKTPISTLKHLAGISYLLSVEIGYTKIESIDDIMSNNLSTLDLEWTKFNKFEKISNFINLTHLRLSGTALQSLKDLFSLRELQRLFINQTDVHSIAGISAFEELTTLSMDGSRVTDLSPISECKKIEILDISNTQIKDLSPLANLTQLKELWIINTPVENLQCLSHFSELEIYDKDFY